MIKKIYFQSIFLSFLLLKEAFATENSGMPQLNPEFWISQIFWLILTFGILLVFFISFGLWKVTVEVNVIKFFKPGNPIRESSEFIDRELTGSMSLLEEPVHPSSTQEI